MSITKKGDKTAHVAVIRTLPCKSKRVSGVGISHEGTSSRVRPTSESRVAGTMVREGSTDLSNDAGVICTSRDVACVSFTIDGHGPQETMGRNVSCCEKWDEERRCCLHDLERERRIAQR